MKKKKKLQTYTFLTYFSIIIPFHMNVHKTQSDSQRVYNVKCTSIFSFFLLLEQYVYFPFILHNHRDFKLYVVIAAAAATAEEEHWMGET